MKIDVSRDVHEENLKRSEALNARFKREKVRVVGILGSPGSGKTTLLENILPKIMNAGVRAAVIEGDIATDNDAKRIAQTGAKAVQIQTQGACHLDTGMVEKAYEGVDAANTDILIIENVGNLVCPVSFPVGEDVRIAVISAAEGEDKPLKYPSAVLKTSALVISKVDIAPMVHVNEKKMAAYARDVNPDIKVFFAGFDADGKYWCKDADGRGIEEYIVE